MKDSEKSIKEIVEETMSREDKIQEGILNYIDKKISHEVIKQMNIINPSIITQKMDELDSEIMVAVKKSHDIYIHDINFEGYVVNTNLGEIIEENDIKFTKIADKMGINRAALSNMIDNPNSISLVNAFKISKLFGISIEDLFSYKK